MTALTSASPPASTATATVLCKSRLRWATGFIPRQCGMLLVLASMTIPNAVVHAKLYKANLILGIVHQRYFPHATS